MMKNWYINLLVLGILTCGFNPLHATEAFVTSTGDNYISADDYFQSFSGRSTTSQLDSTRYISTVLQTSRFAGLNSTKEEFYASNSHFQTLSRMLLGNTSPDVDDDDDDSGRPGHQADPGIPVGTLPFAFLTLLAGGYAAFKRKQCR